MLSISSLRQAFAAVTAAALLAPALAVAEPVSESVRYDDLDLGSSKGHRTLDGRLTRAVRRVCAEPPRPGTRIISSQEHRCRAAAHAEARQTVAQIVAREERGG